jgi:hypothetical protein
MAHFVRSFDSKDEKHAMWLKRVGNVTVKSISGEKVDIIAVVNDNPLPGKPSVDMPTDWAYIHFQLCMKYANAVLNREAFVPK